MNTSAETKDPAAEHAVPPMVDVEGIDVHLGHAHILHQVDLQVAKGEVVALLGANGSGKSTLMRACLGLVPISAGSVRLLGAPVGRSVPWEKIGYVPQRTSQASGVPATAEEVVRTGMLSRRRWWVGRSGREASEKALESVGLADRRGQAWHELSGGQQQRVTIARALVRGPELLMLDEPMAGVDHPSQEVFAELLTQLKAEQLTTVVVLHELGVLRPLIDRAVVIRQGRAVHDGGPPRPATFRDHPEHEDIHPEHGQYEGEPEPHQTTLP